MNLAFPRTDDELPPHRVFSAEDVRRMVDAGVLTEEERIELIEGELVMMASKGYAHELIRFALTEMLMSAKPKDLMVAAEPTLQLSDNVIVEPDIAVFARASLTKSDEGFVRPAQGGVLLVIEIAVSSLRYDKLVKAALYARLGIREYWVIDANERTAWVHTGGSAEGWSSVAERRSDEPLSTPALPGLAIHLDAIG
jgi:Uma2 family endonuclease